MLLKNLNQRKELDDMIIEAEILIKVMWENEFLFIDKHMQDDISN